VAPAAGKVIARVAPMLGMLPDIKDAPEINQALAIPLEPGRPPGAVARGPGMTVLPTDAAAKSISGTSHPDLTVPATMLPPAISRPARDIRRETKAAPRPADHARVLASSPQAGARPVSPIASVSVSPVAATAVAAR
jgi:cell division protein FtsI (penicillin-binding protein 3)